MQDVIHKCLSETQKLHIGAPAIDDPLAAASSEHSCSSCPLFDDLTAQAQAGELKDGGAICPASILGCVRIVSEYSLAGHGWLRLRGG